jgi:hypothetical protein
VNNKQSNRKATDEESSSWVMIGIMDMDGKRLASRKVPCELKEVVKFLAPFTS